MVDADVFYKMARRAGLRVREVKRGHWRIEGGALEVDYWPHSRTRLAHATGTTLTAHEQSAEDALRLAAKGWPSVQPIRRVNRPARRGR